MSQQNEDPAKRRAVAALRWPDGTLDTTDRVLLQHIAQEGPAAWCGTPAGETARIKANIIFFKNCCYVTAAQYQNFRHNPAQAQQAAQVVQAYEHLHRRSIHCLQVHLRTNQPEILCPPSERTLDQQDDDQIRKVRQMLQVLNPAMTNVDELLNALEYYGGDVKRATRALARTMCANLLVDEDDSVKSMELDPDGLY